MNTFYDRISELEGRITDVNDKMPDIEKKRFMRDFIESIELFPECRENGSLLKHIDFNIILSGRLEVIYYV